MSENKNKIQREKGLGCMGCIVQSLFRSHSLLGYLCFKYSGFEKNRTEKPKRPRIVPLNLLLKTKQITGKLSTGNFENF